MSPGARLKRKSVSGGVEKKLTSVKNGILKVGVLRGQGEHPGGNAGQTIAEVAFWNEFGTATIPARSFMRSTLKEEKSVYKKVFRETYRQMLNQKIVINQAIGILGMKVSSDIQHKITQISTPPNADYTKDKKGSSNPLIDTGALRRSITWEKV